MGGACSTYGVRKGVYMVSGGDAREGHSIWKAQAYVGE